MALAGAAIAFRLVNVYQHGLATALREGLVSVAREIELGLQPPTSYQAISYLGYLTGIAGTGVWVTDIAEALLATALAMKKVAFTHSDARVSRTGLV